MRTTRGMSKTAKMTGLGMTATTATTSLQPNEFTLPSPNTNTKMTMGIEMPAQAVPAVRQSPSSSDSGGNTPLTLTPLQRLFSASCGALLTSVLMTPLDVVKTRMQAAAPMPPTDIVCAGTKGKCHVAFPVPIWGRVIHYFSTHLFFSPVFILFLCSFCWRTASECPRCAYFTFDNGLMEHVIPKQNTRIASFKTSLPGFATYNSGVYTGSSPESLRKPVRLS